MGDRELSNNDLLALLNSLCPIAFKFKLFGSMINVERYILLEIEGSNKSYIDKLNDVLEYRLNQEVPLTWQDIVIALRSPAVNEPALASEIESKYLHHSSPQSQGVNTGSSTPGPSSMATGGVSISHHSSLWKASKHEIWTPSIGYYNFPSHSKLPITLHTVPHSPSLSANIQPGPHHVAKNPPPLPGLLTQPSCANEYGAIPFNLPHIPPVAKRPHLESPPPHHPEVESKVLFNTFKGYVKFLYKSAPLEKNIEVLKLKTPVVVFINLAIVDRNTEGLGTEYDEITEAMVRGNVDAIEGRKCPIDMNEIAANLPTKSMKKVIVVEGAPGVGKSTFAFEFCKRWERGEIAQQYDLVLLFRLRDKSISIAKCLRDLIWHPSDRVREAVISELESCQGSNVLLILEGFDELPESSRRVSSIFLQLIMGQHLPFASILITSRPWATRNILRRYDHRIFQHIEVVGLAKLQVNDYIQRALPDCYSDLEGYLERHSQIRMCMYIPLNCAMVVTVYKECKEIGVSLPETLNKFYLSLTHMILRKYWGSLNILAKCIESIDHLPSDIKEKFSSVCKLAYHGIAEADEQVKLIFTDLPEDFDSLGFIDSVFEFYESRKDIASHNFLHLTFQEFLAAVHISKMESDERLSCFKRHLEGRLAVVLRFLAGLKKMSEFYCSSDLVPLLTVVPEYGYYKFKTSIDYFIDNTLVSCLYEAGRDDLVMETLCQGKVVRYSNPSGSLDISALAFCIAHSQCEWVLSFNGKFGREIIDLFAGELRIYNSVGGVIVGATENNSSCISVDSLHYILDKMPVNISRLCIGNVDMYITELVMAEVYFGIDDSEDLNNSGDSCHTISSILPLFPKLTCVTFHECETIIPDICRALADLINNSEHLETIFIIGKLTTIDVVCMNVIFSAIEGNKSLPLKRLYLRGLSTDRESTMSSLVQFIKNRTQPLQLTLPYHISATNALILVRAINENPHLAEQHYRDDIKCEVSTENDAISFIKLMTKYLESVKVVTNVYRITEEGVKCLAGALIYYTNHTLNTLSLRNQNIEIEGARIFSYVLSSNTSLRKLNISGNFICGDGAAALADGLRSNTTLTELNLSRNDIGDDGTIAIAGALWSNSTLIELNISGNNISDDGAVFLAVAIQFNTHLKTLDLSMNEIGERGVVSLLRALLNINCSLEKIDLIQYDGVNITDDMLVSLQSCITSQDENEIAIYGPQFQINHTLKELSIIVTHLDLDKAKVFVALLDFYPALTTLYLELWKVIGDKTYDTLLSVNIQKLKLKLYYTSRVDVLCSALPNNTSRLVELYLIRCGISVSGTKSIAQALTSNTILEKLDLSENRIGVEGSMALAEALNFNKKTSDSRTKL